MHKAIVVSLENLYNRAQDNMFCFLFKIHICMHQGTQHAGSLCKWRDFTVQSVEEQMMSCQVLLSAACCAVSGFADSATLISLASLYS